MQHHTRSLLAEKCIHHFHSSGGGSKGAQRELAILLVILAQIFDQYLHKQHKHIRTISLVKKVFLLALIPRYTNVSIAKGNINRAFNRIQMYSFQSETADLFFFIPRKNVNKRTVFKDRLQTLVQKYGTCQEPSKRC